MKFMKALAALSTICIGSQLSAATYSFEQSYASGGLLTGQFEATDLNGDDVIVSFDGEVTSFYANFYINPLLPVLSFTADNFALIFDLDGSSVLGDGVVSREGLGSVDETNSVAMLVGPGPLVACNGIDSCAAVFLLATGDLIDTAVNPLIVTELAAVPLPASGLLMGGGVIGLGLLRRRRRA